MHLTISGVLALMKCGMNTDEYPDWIDFQISCNGLCFSHRSLSLSVIATLLDFVRFFTNLIQAKWYLTAVLNAFP